MLISRLFHTQRASPLFHFGVGFVSLVSFALLSVILWLNQGFFTYTLDDPYIHLALAQNIAQGHYGINAGEFSAPSSSIIWPFLLVPLARTGIGLYVPLVISLLASFGTIAVFSAAIEEIMPQPQTGKLANKRIVLVWLILATNMLGLVFIGMEHSLQVFCVALIVWGLWQHGRTGQIPPDLVFFLVLAPLIRYDNLAIVVPALLYLLWNREDRSFLMASIGVGITVGGFSLFLLWLGLDILPDSISVKSNVVSGSNRLTELWWNLQNAWSSLAGFWLSLGGLVLGCLAVWRRKDKQASRFAICLGLGVLLHFLVGRFGWFSRYEIYIWTAVLLGLIYMLAPKLGSLLDKQPIGRVSYTTFLLLVVTVTPYLRTQIQTPLAANNIYEQHYQMHRFAIDYYQRPFAVHDLGYVAYNNDDYYVLDLWGLASPGAFEERQSGNHPVWLAEATESRNIDLVMVFGGIFPEIPPQWEAAATLKISRQKALGTETTIIFYGTSAESAAEIRTHLEKMEATLPEGQSFQFESLVGSK